MADLSSESAHCCSQVKCHLVQTSNWYIKLIALVCTHDLDMTLAKILPYRPPTQLIRAKYFGPRGEHATIKQLLISLIPFRSETPPTRENNSNTKSQSK